METILSGIPSVRGVWRDRGDVQRMRAPAIIMLDGSEQRLTQFRPSDGVQMPPGIFQVKPQVAIVLPPRDTVQNTTLGGADLPVGPALSAYRTLIVSAILNDDTLIDKCSPSGQITYDGYRTDMDIEKEIGAFGPFMVFMFSLSYSVDPEDLATPETIAAAQAEIAARWN
jgi:hypothetical protein